LFLQELDLEIKDKKGVKNQVVDHSNRLLSKNDDGFSAIKECFLDKKLFALYEFCPWIWLTF